MSRFTMQKRSILALGFGFLGWCGFPVSLQAQVIPDGSLGSENSVVRSAVTVQGTIADLIEGGALRGSNLFHSFEELNTATGQRVYFANPQGVNWIFSRVTGANASDFQGTLGVDGAANLFLLNPQGFLFGAGSTLDLAGSLVVSTAEAIDFGLGNGSVWQFSAQGQETPPLLTLTLEPGLQAGRVGSILENRGTLRLGSGQTLSLVADTIVNRGRIQVPGGRVYLLGKSVELLDQSSVQVSGTAGGGTIVVGGQSPILAVNGTNPFPATTALSLGANARLEANALVQGTGGEIYLSALDRIDLAGTIEAKGRPGLTRRQAGGGRLEMESNLLSISSAIATENVVFRAPSFVLRDGDGVNQNNIFYETYLKTLVQTLGVSDLTFSAADGVRSEVIKISAIDFGNPLNTTGDGDSTGSEDQEPIDRVIQDLSVNLTLIGDRNGDGRGNILLTHDLGTAGGNLTLSG
ncbi:MAG: filamentous hemagglutinin N-terminal domain-containing protein, partial [Prochlorotrichaceae cyanobacterium]